MSWSCENCPRREECSEPCEALLSQIDSPDRGRLARNIGPEKSEEVEEILAVSAAFDPVTDAILHLHYRSSFTMARIGRAFGMNRSSISRRIAKAWQQHRQNAQQERHM